MVMRVYGEILDASPGRNALKQHALYGHEGGVPLREQESLVGSAASRRSLSPDQIVPLAGWTSATLVGSAVVATDDFLVLTAGGQRYSISREDLYALTPPHDEGDDLIVGGADVKRLVSDAGTHSILVGRTSDNRPLWQESDETGFLTLDSNDVVQVYAEEWTGGLIGQRYTTLLGLRRVTASLRTRSAAQPADPPGTTTFDGSHARNASPWVAYDESLPSGSDPVWVAISEVVYIPGTNSWQFGTWRIVREDSSFDLMFAATEEGPYRADYQAGDTWAQQRHSDGSFSRFRLGGDPVAPRTWVHVGTLALPTTLADVDGPWSTTLHRLFRPSDHVLLMFEWELRGFAGEEMRHIVNAPATTVRETAAILTAPAIESGVTWKMAFGQSHNDHHYISQTSLNTREAGNSAYNQFMSVDFYRTTGSLDPAGYARYMSIRALGNDDRSGTLRVYAL